MPNIEDYRRILQKNFWKTDRTFVPPQVASWLFTEASMTEKLQAACQDFAVQVQHEELMADGQWRREVLLQGDGKDWVFAQSDFSPELMAQFKQDIVNLGVQPLGYWLFAQPMQREKLEWLYDSESGLYARRSLLRINGAPMSVIELFLADFQFKESA